MTAPLSEEERLIDALEDAEFQRGLDYHSDGPDLRPSGAARAALLALVETLTKERDEALQKAKEAQVLADEKSRCFLVRAQTAEANLERVRALLGEAVEMIEGKIRRSPFVAVEAWKAELHGGTS